MAFQHNVLSIDFNFGLNVFVDFEAWGVFFLATRCCGSYYNEPRHMAIKPVFYHCDDCNKPCEELAINDKWIKREEMICSPDGSLIETWIERLLPTFEAALVWNSLKPLVEDILEIVNERDSITILDSLERFARENGTVIL